MPSPAGAALLHECFDARWREWRDRPALDIPPGPARPARLVATYGDLAGASQAIEDRVRHLARPDAVMAVLLPRPTVAAFAAPLGILRAGAAFTCIDAAFPDARIADLIRDAEPVAIVTDAAGAGRLARLGIEPGRLVAVETLAGGLPASRPPAGAVAQRPSWLLPTSLAYVIYTSGTTGRPKGVMIEHRAIANLVASDIGEFGLTAADRVAQSSSHAYDSSIEEIWLALAAGATLVVMDEDVARSGPDLVPWLEREAITMLCPTPTMLRATGCRNARGLLPDLRLIYVGGEALTTDVVDAWAAGRRFVNGYGPTESAVTCIRTDVVPGAAVAIGRPVPHVEAWVLTDGLEDVQGTETGELCLGGAGLARGYWRDPDLTARKFLVHPVHGRIYRTGDLATRLPDGTLFCLGRVDSQVKIRGYRIELGEIEARLGASAGVREAACAVQGDAAARRSSRSWCAVDAAAPPDLDRAAARTHGGTAGAHGARASPTHRRAADDHRRQARSSRPACGRRRRRRGTGASRSRREPTWNRASRRRCRRVSRRGAPISVTRQLLRGSRRRFPPGRRTDHRTARGVLTAGLTVRDAYAAPTIERLARQAAGAGGANAIPRSRPEPGGKPGMATLIQRHGCWSN